MKYLITFIFVSLSWFPLATNAQQYKFQVYNSEDYNIYPYIYTLHQDKTGYLWVGTGEGLYRFDGRTFQLFSTSDSLAENFTTASVSDDHGLNWFGHNNGNLSCFNGKEFKSISLPSESPGCIQKLQVDNEDNLWVVSQNDGIFVRNINGEIKHISGVLAETQLYCMEQYGNLIIAGSNDGIFLIDKSDSKISQPENSPLTKIECISKSNTAGTFFIGTSDEGVYKLSFNKTSRLNPNIDPVFTDDSLDKFPVKDIQCLENGDLFIAGMGNGLFYYQYDPKTGWYKKPTRYTSSNGLGYQNINRLFIDNENILWIGTYGNGLAAFSERFFTFLMQSDKQRANIYSIHSDNNTVWIGGKGELMAYANNQTDYTGPVVYSNGIPDDAITALYSDINGKIWLGTETSGLYTFDAISHACSPFKLAEDQLSNSINAIDGSGEQVFAAPKNGLYIIHSDNKKPSVTNWLNTSNGLPHNYINHILVDLNHNVWIATPTNILCKYKPDGDLQKIRVSPNNEPIKINSIAIDNNGKLWLGTYGNGIFYKTDTGFVNITSSQGLFSDYCYNIIVDQSGIVWAGHRKGLSSIKHSYCKTYSKSKGINTDFSLNAVNTDKNGVIWFGTNNGILRYDYRQNLNLLHAPGTAITNIKFNETDYCPDSILEIPYGSYKLKIEFVGISFTDPDKVSFQYLLDGYDNGWSEKSNTNYAFYPRIEDGTYTFELKATSGDGITNKDPINITIRIAAPFWKKWWFISLFIITFIYGFYLFIKIRERNHRKLEEFLKKTLDERTKEVIEQKELIELKNKDITDSINYAKRIQEAILPSNTKQKNTFPKSFVFYLPRDIVSGDFFLFNKFGSKGIAICADATGHGVPGAFMSLISSTIIKDILTKSEISSPSAVLDNLDHDIRETLNQSDSGQQTNDGLDIAVCEIDTETRILTFASAMRPMLLNSNGVFKFIQGSRFSIGGEKTPDKKIFEETKVQCYPGDRIYLFTDGFADQFGGTNGKKLKNKGFIEIFKEINQYPISQQESILKEKFIAWKGNNFQVDDVLIIGIEIL